MKIKDSIKYLLGKSLKEIKMGNIKNKISNNIKLSEKEGRFLNLYNSTTNDLCKDYMLISKNTVFNKVKILLNNDKKIICNLKDREGKIGELILDIINDFETDCCDVYLSNNKKHRLDDRYLYNIIYNNKKDIYLLEEHDEYFEKIEISND